MKSANRIGIWLNQRNAYIINPDRDELSKVTSEIDEFNPKGGYGSSTPYEQQDAMSEQRFLRRKNQQQKKYFDLLCDEIKGASQILIMGPGETRIHFAKELEKRPGFKGKIVGNYPHDSMTKNQIMAAAKDYFNNEQVNQ